MEKAAIEEAAATTTWARAGSRVGRLYLVCIDLYVRLHPSFSLALNSWGGRLMTLV